MDLHPEVDDPSQHLSRPPFRLGGLLDGEPTRHVLLEQPIDEDSSEVDLGPSLCELESIVLEGSHRAPEGHALPCVRQREFQRGLRTGHGTDCDRESFLRQVVDQLEERHPLLAQPIRGRNLDVGEEQLGGVLGMQAHLVEIASSFEAGHAVLDDEQGQASVRILRRSSNHDHQIGVDTARDEGLRSVHDIRVTVVNCSGCYAREIGSGAGLGHRYCCHQLTRSEAGEPTRPLIVVAVLQEVGQAHVVVEDDGHACGARTGSREHLVDHRVVSEVVNAAATVCVGNGHAEQTRAASSSKHGLGNDPCLVPCLRMREDLTLEEALDRFAEQVVIGLEYGTQQPRDLQAPATFNATADEHDCPFLACL